LLDEASDAVPDRLVAARINALFDELVQLCKLGLRDPNDDPPKFGFHGTTRDIQKVLYMYLFSTTRDLRLSKYNKMKPKIMAIIGGKPKRQTGYKLTQGILDQIDNAVKSGEFPNNTSVVEAALREFFFRRTVDQQIRAFLESDEGKRLIRRAFED